jgi:hypothetical protein
MNLQYVQQPGLNLQYVFHFENITASNCEYNVYTHIYNKYS